MPTMHALLANATLSCPPQRFMPPPVNTSLCVARENKAIGVPSGEPTIPLFVKWEDYVPDYLPELVGVTFVQVGANCGRNHVKCSKGGDPIWNYAASCAWRGIAIEPMRRAFELLCNNYATITPLVHPLQAVVSDRPGAVWMSRRGEASSVITPPLPLAEGDDSRERVTALTLEDVWPRDNGGAAVLVIDAEGYEETILAKGSLPRPLPQLVLFEHVHLSEAARASVDANLRRQGYSLVAELRHFDKSAVRHHNVAPQDRLYMDDVDEAGSRQRVTRSSRRVGQRRDETAMRSLSTVQLLLRSSRAGQPVQFR